MGKATQSCTCVACIECCKRTPGWFAPGEAESAAALLGMGFDEFKQRFLIVDYWVASPNDIDVLAPRKVGIEADQPRASWSYAFERGRCVFLTDENRCRIHQAKPIECREAFDCRKGQGRGREKIAEMWQQSGLTIIGNQ